MFFFDKYYFLLVIPSLIVAVWAQIRVKTTFNKYNRVFSARGYTAAAVARRILDSNGLQHIPVYQVPGNLSDHFDPRTNTVNLSSTVHDSTSVAAIGIAAHEVGHAIQHAAGYAPIKARSALVPVANIGSTVGVFLVVIGIVMSMEMLSLAGIILFSAIVVFQLVTLPVELNASRRAVATLDEMMFLDGEELKGAKKVLTAAALTYVAALFVAIMQLLRLILLRENRRR